MILSNGISTHRANDSTLIHHKLYTPFFKKHLIMGFYEKKQKLDICYILIIFICMMISQL